MKYAWKDIPRSSHRILLDWITSRPAGLRVLEVGTGPGELGRRIRSHCRHLVGIEINGDAVFEAQPFYSRIIQGDACIVLPECKEKFDLVILADILEHLEAPDLMLRQVLPLLEENGRVFISVPNIANITVRLGLLFGKFNYTDRGLLDRTHLRFFTLKTLRKMLATTGFFPLRVYTSAIPVELALPWVNKRPLRFAARSSFGWLAGIFPTLFGYQFICEAVPLDKASLEHLNP